MTTDSIILTPEEIAQYRQQLSDVPEAIAFLNVIDECEGYLEDATLLFVMRKTGQEPDRSSINLEELSQKCREVICKEETEDVLELFNIVAPFLALNPLGISVSMAIPMVIYVTKIGRKRFCQESSENET